MPKKKQVTVPDIFNQFVSSLGALIRAKVAESVQAATQDFFAGHFGKAPTAKAEKKPRKKRGRMGREKGSKSKKAVVAEKPALK